jgi:ABC-type transport system involved in multi-copper enzyme maturation permease subunit
MIEFNPKAVFYIAKKEFLDNIRNRWIILLTIIFVILALVVSYAAGVQSGGEELFGAIEDTILVLTSISILLIPIIAIVLGYSTIVGEAEKGSLQLILSYPVRRFELILGKFFGLGSVLFTTILLGFGLSGIIIMIFVGTDQWLKYLISIFMTLLLALIYLSVMICVSSLVKRKVAAIGGGLLLYFWSMIYGIAVIVIFATTGGDTSIYTDPFTSLESIRLPDWMWQSIFLSPSDLNSNTIMRILGINQAFGFRVIWPSYMTKAVMILGHFIWITVPLTLSYFIFKRRDV